MRKTPRPPYLQGVPSRSPRYWYIVDERTKTRISCGGNQAIAEMRLAEYKAQSSLEAKPLGLPTLADAIQSYYETDAFLQDIKPRTRELYRHYAEQLRASDLAASPLDAIDVDVVLALQDTLKSQPSKCYQTLAILQTVMSHAIAKRMVAGPNPVNGIKRRDRVKSAARDAVWMPEQVDAFIAVARPSLRLAMLLLLYTAQRPSDVLAMTRGQVIRDDDGRFYINVRQEKTGKLVALPVHREHLEPALRARLADPSGGMMLVSSPTGLVWTRRNFSRAWDVTRKKAKLPTLQRRDLRRTAVVYMASKGLSVPQIAHITGHSLKSVDQMLDQVYLPRQRAVALSGVKLWEQGDRPSIENLVPATSVVGGKR